VKIPRLIIFEGGDGSGKTTLLDKTEAHIREKYSDVSLLKAWFPGRESGTLGELIYSIHHKRKYEILDPDPIALQLLHLAAHVDQLRKVIIPHFNKGGHVLLDRSWWSTYAYSRSAISAEDALKLVQAEWPFWRDAPKPMFIFMHRDESLKPEESSKERHRELLKYYGEIMVVERDRGTDVRVVNNNGTEDDALEQIISHLAL
jgi:thymidylate kinase